MYTSYGISFHISSFQYSTGFVYPVVVRAVWSDHGFLNYDNGKMFGEEIGIGVIDFAGSGVVHITGGTTALMATKILKPRKGRFHDIRGRKLDVPTHFPGHSAALQVIGTFILWFAWYVFISLIPHLLLFYQICTKT